MNLVDRYCHGSSFFFGTRAHSLLTQGKAITLPGRGNLAPRRAERVLSALGKHQIVVGAIPFDDNEPAQLIVPEHHEWGPALAPQLTASAPIPVQTSQEPDKDAYRRSVAEALRTIDETELVKVVLARSIRIHPEQRPDIATVLKNLRYQESGFIFSCELPENRTLIGGSPELLVSRQGDTVLAHPLAGSRPRTGDPLKDHASANELLSSEKDRHEHALVVDDITRTLMPYCAELSAPSTPEIIETAHMIHLGTRIQGKLADPKPSALTLAAALHPTPAIGGTPTATAQRTIAKLEGFHRGFYTGTVGWCDSDGNGEWAVTIRCAELADDSTRLFAGAGIVAGSDPDLELAETEAKLATMLAALGHSQELTSNERSIHAMA